MSNARELAEVGGSYGQGGFVGMKNRIINGAMMIDQRNAGAEVNPVVNASYGACDRFKYWSSQTIKYKAKQNAGGVTPPQGFSNYLGLTSLSAYTLNSTDYFHIQQTIEGYNWADLNWGTANAQTATLSFWVRSSLTGTFGGTILSQTNDYNYPFAYTIPTANTWVKIELTITPPTSGTWDTTNSGAATVVFSIGHGSTRQGTAGVWTTDTNIRTCTGQTNVVGTNGATFYITGVQLEKGSTATSFDYRPYGTELGLAQRYYQRITTNGGAGYGFIGSGYAFGTATLRIIVPFKTSMRVAPNGIETSAMSTFLYFGGTESSPLTSISYDANLMTSETGGLTCNKTGGFTNGSGGALLGYGTNNAYVGFIAEL